MSRRGTLSIPLALALLGSVAATAAAQDPPPPPPPGPNVNPGDMGGPPGPMGGPSPAPAGDAGGMDPAASAGAEEKVDREVDVRGNRYKIRLRRGATIEGVLPRGIYWERVDKYGEFISASESDKGAGIRLHFVLNLDGELFIKKAEIALREEGEGGGLEIRDLGELTEDQRAAIRDRVLAQRLKAHLGREKALREEMARLNMKDTEPAAGAGGAEDAEAKKENAEAEADRQGEALLAKFPPGEWSEQRIKDILQREVINGIFRSDQEKEFIDNFKTWQAALDRREKAEAEKKAAGEKDKPAPKAGE